MSEVPAALAWAYAPARVHQILCVIAGLAVRPQSLARLSVSSSFSERGVWRWSTLRLRYERLPRPLLALLDRLLGEKGVRALLVGSCLAAGSMLVTPSLAAMSLRLLVTFQLRFWGSVNGQRQHDALVLLSATVTELAGQGPRSERPRSGTSVPALASYMLAGLVKVQSASWRRGRALDHHLRSAGLGSPPGAVSRIIRSRTGGIVTCWSVILFELLAPMSLLDPRLTSAFVAVALAFHMMNAWLLGLPVHAGWLSSHVALSRWPRVSPANYRCDVSASTPRAGPASGPA